jgi:hypothetical protein
MGMDPHHETHERSLRPHRRRRHTPPDRGLRPQQAAHEDAGPLGPVALSCYFLPEPHQHGVVAPELLVLVDPALLVHR